MKPQQKSLESPDVLTQLAVMGCVCLVALVVAYGIGSLVRYFAR